MKRGRFWIKFVHTNGHARDKKMKKIDEKESTQRENGVEEYSILPREDHRYMWNDNITGDFLFMKHFQSGRVVQANYHGRNGRFLFISRVVKQ